MKRFLQKSRNLRLNEWKHRYNMKYISQVVYLSNFNKQSSINIFIPQIENIN